MAKTDKIDATLLPGESVVARITGTLIPDGKSTGTTRGVIALTNRRFLFVGTAWGASESRQIVLKQVTSVSLRKNLMNAHLEIAHAGGSDRYQVNFKEAQDFAATAQGAVTAIQLA